MTARYRRTAAAIVLMLLGTSCKEPADPPDAYSVRVDVTPWIHALESDGLFESEPALESLVALGPAAIPPLEAALQRETAAIRLGVVEALERLRLPEAVPPLIRAAGDPEELVRAEALMALGRLGDARAIPWLAEVVASGNDERLRVHAVTALGSLADPAALETLRRAARDESPLLRASACAALANLARQGVEGAGDVSKACSY